MTIPYKLVITASEVAEQQATNPLIPYPQELEEISNQGGHPQPLRKARDGLAPAMQTPALTYPSLTATFGK